MTIWTWNELLIIWFPFLTWVLVHIFMMGLPWFRQGNK